MRMVSHPWLIFLLLQMVSHPGSLAEQFLFVNEDGVPSWLLVEQFKYSSWNLLLMWMVSHPGHSSMLMDGVLPWSRHQNYERRKEPLLVDLQILQSWCHDYPGHGTKIMRGKDGFSATVFSSIWCHNNPGHSTRIMRGKETYLVVSWVDSEITKPGATRCHGTRN